MGNVGSEYRRPGRSRYSKIFPSIYLPRNTCSTHSLSSSLNAIFPTKIPDNFSLTTIWIEEMWSVTRIRGTWMREPYLDQKARWTRTASGSRMRQSIAHTQKILNQQSWILHEKYKTVDCPDVNKLKLLSWSGHSTQWHIEEKWKQGIQQNSRTCHCFTNFDETASSDAPQGLRGRIGEGPKFLLTVYRAKWSAELYHFFNCTEEKYATTFISIPGQTN